MMKYLGKGKKQSFFLSQEGGGSKSLDNFVGGNQDQRERGTTREGEKRGWKMGYGGKNFNKREKTSRSVIRKRYFR